jgi:outer membrane protein assembly factor BamB
MKISLMFLSSIIAIIFIFSLTCLADNWTQFQGDIQNNGITSDKAPITAPESPLCWDVYTSATGMAGIDIVPLVAGDMVYVAAYDGSVRAYDWETGELQWVRPSSGGGFLTGNLAYAEGKLFVPTNAGKIHAYNGATGLQLWNVVVSSGELDSPLTYYDGRIYVGDFEGEDKYYCYDTSGFECWNRSSSSGEQYKWTGTAIVGESNNYLVFGDDGSYLTSVYKNNGTTVDELNISSLWANFDAKEIRSSICYDEQNNRIYLSSRAGYCFSIGMNHDGSFNSSDIARQNLGLASTSTPVVYNDRVYVGAGLYGSSGKLCCLNASDLSLIWYYSPNGGVQASPVVSTAYDDGDGEVYIYFTSNNEDAKVYCLKDFQGNTQSKIQWEYQPATEKNGYTIQGVSVSCGRLFYGNDEGYLFSLATGESLQTQTVFSNFTANVTSGDVPLTVEFTDLSTGASLWRWDVDGDGEIDYTIKNPVHTYDSPGVYNVTLNVIGSQGTASRTKQNYINVDWNPWNDPESEDGELISNSEMQTAVIKWKNQIPLQDVDYVISNSDIQTLVIKWKNKT